MSMNGYTYVPIKLYLWTSSFDFHEIFHESWNILLLIVFNHLKTVKTILSSEAIQKGAMEWTRSMVHSLLSPVHKYLAQCVAYSACPVADVNTFVIHISKRASGSGFLVLQSIIPQTPGNQPSSGTLLFLLILLATGLDLSRGWDLGRRWGEAGCIKSMPWFHSFLNILTAWAQNCQLERGFINEEPVKQFRIRFCCRSMILKDL